MTTTPTLPQSLDELRTKLRNLVGNVDDRLEVGPVSLAVILDRVLDRIFELATTPGIQGICRRCGTYPATSYVHAGIPGSNDHRAQAVCVHCTLHTITWASTAGVVHVDPYPTPSTVEVAS